MIQKSLVLMKPDAVKRGIVGEILHRFERAGLKIVAMKMVHVGKELAEAHYLTTDENLAAMGNKTLADCKENDIDVTKSVGSDEPVAIGRQIWKWNIDFLTSGPVIAVVFEGSRAIENIRTMAGHTLPLKAVPGTIRGDYSLESSVGANLRNRAIYNLVHASGNLEEAEREIKLWFKPEEFCSYKRIHEDLYSY
jgi:nucleoside-diphosphate kinase